MKIPATVVTGFLGAGKTSMIRHLLASAGGKRLALIINEFGDLGIDRDLLTGCGDVACADGDIVELTNGCICCTVADDFLPTMTALIERAAPPDHIVIETSGLALPKPLVTAFRWPEIRARATVDGVIAVVDAPAVAAGRFSDAPPAGGGGSEQPHGTRAPGLGSGGVPGGPLAEVFTDQVACADLVVLNKTDLLDADSLAAVRAQVAAPLRPATGVVASVHGRVDPRLLLGLGIAAEVDLAARPSLHDDTGAHDHDDFATFVVEFDSETTPTVLADRIRAAAERHDILRLKGFVAVSGRDRRLAVQAVGPRVDHYFDRPWRDGEARVSRLVVIGERALDADAVRAALTA